MKLLTRELTLSGQRIGIAFASTSKTYLEQGTFDLNGPNIKRVGYFADWREERDATDQNTYSNITAAEITISKTGEDYRITLSRIDEQNNSITA